MANNRERLLFLLKTLMDNTDATHDLTLKDLEAIYKENGISGTPKTIRADFQTLEEMGFHVVASPNAGKATVYSYEQTFEGPELKMIIDGVSAAKFISPGNTQMLIRKLLGLTSRTAADEILQNLDPTDHHESPNKKLFDTIQVITRARDQKKKISYQYYDFFSWVFQYNGRIRIVEPEIVTQEYAGMLGRLLRYYQNFGQGIPKGNEPR